MTPPEIEALRRLPRPLTRDELDALCDAAMEAARLRQVLKRFASYLTTDEGDADDTEETFGLAVSEVIEMAHDDMIRIARAALERKP